MLEFLVSREKDGAISEPASLRLAWFTINTAILYGVQLRRDRLAPIRQSLDWFFATHARFAAHTIECFSKGALDIADEALSSVSVDDTFLDLLPYVLEPHGHVTRTELENHAGANERRERKRHSGVFYTPSDVVEFMVGEVAKEKPSGQWLDPACGTAVFLREVLRIHAPVEPVKFCRDRIYGFDISALTTESATFVLLNECARATDLGTDAFSQWQAIGNNILPLDSLRISSKGLALARLFRNAQTGFDCIVMNPPYAATRLTSEAIAEWQSFHELKPGDRGNAELAFVEMMWKFGKVDSVAGAVLPLSFAASSKSQYKACRRAVTRAGGTWDFLFFDREPHALFGEDIKTRNAVVFRSGGSSSEPARLYTSRMLKWTSAMRPGIFTRHRTTQLEAMDIEAFIPKLGSEAEQRIYEILKCREVHALPEFRRTTLDAIGKLRGIDAVVIGSTAYNFLNAFLPEGVPNDAEHALSQSPVHILLFDSSSARNVAFATLSSRLFFWLWHVEGDGFHVTVDFLARSPLWGLAQSTPQGIELEALGAAIWQRASNTRLTSLNGGRATYSFHCPFQSEVVDRVDTVLLRAMNAPEHSLDALKAFVANTTSIDGSNRRLKFHQKEPKK